MLCVLAHRMGYKFEKHYLYVSGSFSKIAMLEELAMTNFQKYELYLPSNEDRFNNALTMLLELVALFCNSLKDYKDFVESKNIQIYEIDGHLINKSSIKYSKEN